MKKKFFVFLMLLFITSLVLGQQAGPPTQTTTNLEVGLQIFYPEFKAVKLDEGFLLHLHVNNKSNGLVIDNSLVNCTLHIYNTTGYHIFQGVLNKDDNNVDHELFLNKNNFSIIGTHAFNIYCETNSLGGEVSGLYDVTYHGLSDGDGIVKTFFSLLFIIIISYLVGSLLYVVYKSLSLDFTDKDLVIFISSYLGVYAYFILQQYYLGNVFINDLLIKLLSIGGFTHVVLPIIMFFVSWFKARTDEVQRELNGGMPIGFKYG